MFFHNFKYSLKTLLHNKILIFWTFAFPILLGVFFYMAFSNIEKEEQLDTIDIAIIPSEKSKTMENLKQILISLKDEKSNKNMFHIKEVNKKTAEKMLDKEEITGYIYEDSTIKIMVDQSGVNETILRYTIDSITSNQNMIEDLSKREIEEQIKKNKSIPNKEMIIQEVSEMVNKDTINLKDTSNNNLSYTMIEYYTLIAMACLYGGILSMFVINYRLANMNSVGKRTHISPISKIKMICGSLLASYIVQLIGIGLLFLFTIFILNVDYGSNLFYVVLLSICGSFAGLSLGVVVATLVKASENTKIGILIAITMLGCFLSGMMGITMKYVIDKNVPILNKINPANMITDGLYSLYYYNTYHRFLFNIISLLLFSGILIAISIYGLRRQKYDSI